MISIITPFYNAQKFLEQNIQSVLCQNIQDWELILINDGSNDNSKEVALSFDDKRVTYIEQENKGVSAARNLGLSYMSGEYFCFLDADDVLLPNSLKSRLSLFHKNPSLDFVDGQIQVMDAYLQQQIRIWKPAFIGNPLSDLARQTGKSFFNPSWLIKRKISKSYRFHEGLTHGEDLLFLMEIAREGGQYSYVNEPILQYRNTPNSAMKNLKGLEKGYRYIENEIKDWSEINQKDLYTFNYRYRRAMFLSYLRTGKLWKAIRSFS